MATTNITLSIPIEFGAFLNEKRLKPSKILQERIQELMESEKISPEYVRSLNEQIVFQKETINLQREFLKAHGLMEDFLNFEKQ